MATKDIFEQDPQKYMSGSISDVFALPRAAAGYLGNKANRAFGVDDPYATNPYIESIKTGVGSPEGSARLGIGTKGALPVGIGESSGVLPMISFGSGNKANKIKTEYTPRPSATQTVQAAPKIKPQSKGAIGTAPTRNIPLPQPTVSWDSAPQTTTALPDTNYGSYVDDNGMEHRVYTPDTQIKGGNYTDNVMLHPFKESVSQSGPLPNIPTGRSAYFAQQEATPGSQREWEMQQAGASRLQTALDNLPPNIKNSPFAYSAANAAMKHNDEIGIKQGELALKQGDAPFERGYKAALTGNTQAGTARTNALTPIEVGQGTANIGHIQTGTQGILADIQGKLQEISQRNDLHPLKKQELRANIQHLVSTGKLQEAQALLTQAETKAVPLKTLAPFYGQEKKEDPTVKAAQDILKLYPYAPEPSDPAFKTYTKALATVQDYIGSK